MSKELPSNQSHKKDRSRLSGFIGYAIVVFVALLVSLVVIYLRSSA